MINIEKADDLLGITVNNLLSYRKDDKKFIKLVNNWNKKVIIEIEKLYPLEVIFEGNQVKFKIEDLDSEVDLKIMLSLGTFLDLAYGRSNPIKATITRKVKIKGLYRIPTLFKFLKIFVKSMKIVAKDPNQNYYELNKETR
jgi:putative sterol carrier protein